MATSRQSVPLRFVLAYDIKILIRFLTRFFSPFKKSSLLADYLYWKMSSLCIITACDLTWISEQNWDWLYSVAKHAGHDFDIVTHPIVLWATLNCVIYDTDYNNQSVLVWVWFYSENIWRCHIWQWTNRGWCYWIMHERHILTCNWITPTAIGSLANITTTYVLICHACWIQLCYLYAVFIG